MSNLLAAYKNIPEYFDESNLRAYSDQARKIWVTEDIQGDTFDILLDQATRTVKFRLNGKGRDPELKRWKTIFEQNTGKEYLITTSPIPSCIIRTKVVKSPEFMKVLAIAIVDDGEVRWVPFKMIEHFCNATNMSPMPTIFQGGVDYKQLGGLAHTPVLGVPRNGVLIIPDETPVKYIKLSMNVDEDILRRKIEEDQTLMKNLVDEFCTLAFDIADFKQAVHDERELETFIKTTISKTNDSTLLAEYKQRCLDEAGVSEQTSEGHLKESIILRSKKLFKDVIQHV
jgi:hypothetical protein